jgi:hypothetical protein
MASFALLTFLHKWHIFYQVGGKQESSSKVWIILYKNQLLLSVCKANFYTGFEVLTKSLF